MKDENGNEIIVSTETVSTPNETVSEAVSKTEASPNQIDLNSIQELIQKTVEASLKNIMNQSMNNTTTIKPQTIKPESVDVEAIVEKRMQQMEQKMFMNTLKQNEIEYLKNIPEYESLKPSQIKAILSKISLPNIETPEPKSQGGSLDSYIKLARGSNVK